MDRDRFWNIIASARDGGEGDFEGRPERLRALLLELTPAEVTSFITNFEQVMDDAYSHELWGAAYVIGGGCSDDSFTDFRKWLISCGREVYERALVAPESLADVHFGPDGEQDAFFEEFSIVIAIEVFQELAGSDPPERDREHQDEPSGTEWDEEDLPELYPRLWARWSEG